jgi:diacylglycerol kinase (ATP)
MPIAVIINPISGGARAGQAEARARLAGAVVERHGEAAEIVVTERRGHAREVAERAVARGARLVIAWGGDGTLNEVASALAFGDVPLGIVPAGSGNGLACDLGVDRRPEQAIADALQATPRPIDLGEVNGRIFVNTAGVGFDAHVAAVFDRRGGRRGFRRYVAITGRALLTYRPEHYTITTPDSCRTSRAVLIAIANSSQFGNGARIAPGAALDDGLLDLVVFEERARWRTIGSVPRLFNGTVNQVAGCSMCRIREARIESDRPIAFHLDGEPAEGVARLDVRVHPGALRVAVRSSA